MTAAYHGEHRRYNRQGLLRLTEAVEKSGGRVSLVGAGPGDPKLITLAGVERLRRADVIVTDALVSPQLLGHARPDALVIDVGKRRGQHTVEQGEINDLLVAHAQAGRFVVRLKGGDPYIFGRGAEEAVYVASRGIDVEIVPGVTSATAAPLAAGVPLTHRELASTVTFVTGHEDPAKPDSAVDYDALARLVTRGGTLAFFMGMSRLAAITARLGGAGAAADTPAAIVEWGATPRQRSVRGTLANIADAATKAGLTSPAIIVVGPVAGLNEPGLDFFVRRPLFGQRIVITRTRQQASALRDRLEELGADVLEAPTIALVPPEDWSQVDDALRHIADYDWLVLTSANGVEAVASRLDALRMDARNLAGVKVAVIGDATAAAAATRLRLRADAIPDNYVAEALADELIKNHGVAGQRMLLLRADIARPALPRLLTEAGAAVTELTAYQTKLADALPDPVRDALREGSVDWVTFMSSSTARNMVELLGGERDLLKRTKLASIGPITSQTIRALGFEPTVEAATSNMDGLIEAMIGVNAP